MNLLVAGADRVDAGKTTFSRGLVARLAADGTAPVGFKPRAGNDYWFDHDDVRAVLAEGRLHGKDAKLLAAAGAGETAPETLNAVHRLWRPTPDRRGLLGESGRTFLVDRVTTPDGPAFVLNSGAEVPERVREALPLSDAREVASVDALNDAMADLHLPALRRLADRVERTPHAVVESYGDIARPLRDVEFDAVGVVDPGNVRVYDGRRFMRACDVARGSPREGTMETRVGAVLDMVDFKVRVPLPALSSDERADAGNVAVAYGEAYDALLSAV